MPPKPNFQELSFPFLPVFVLSLAFVLLIFSISPYYQRQEPILPIYTDRKSLITPTIYPTSAYAVPPNKYSSVDCPSNGWVNCMPIVAPERQYQCEKHFLDWARTNCPGFQGAAL